jgi:ribosome-associated translation inhibitor RaiA
MIARKLGKLATYCRRLKDEGSSIRMESEARDTKKQRDHIKVMVNVVLPRKTFRVESRKATIIEALDSCIEKLEPQVKRYNEMYSARQMQHLIYTRRNSRRTGRLRILCHDG